VKYFSKSCLLAALLLIFSGSVPAQRFVSGGGFPSFGNGGFGGGYGFGNYGWGNYGWDYGFGYSSSDFCLHHPQEHPPFGVESAHGDPDFIQSTFMDYDKALALGKKVLEEQAKPQPSLGEIARQLRQRARKYVPAPAPPRSGSAPASGEEKYLVIQDNQGNLLLCRTDSDCGATT